MAIILFVLPHLLSILSLSLFNVLFLQYPGHNVITNPHFWEKISQATPKQRKRIFKFFPHRLHQFQQLRLLEKRKSSIWAKHLQLMRLWQLKLLFPQEIRWRLQILLKYFKKTRVRIRCNPKEHCVAKNTSKLVNEAPRRCKLHFSRSRPVSICIWSFHTR